MEIIYNELGWQGGTVHQIVSEIKRLKKSDRVLKSLVSIIVSESSLCEPDIDYKLMDIIDDKCLNCQNLKICKFLIENDLY